MTNTLHRRGTEEDLKKDFIVFCLVPKGPPDVAAITAAARAASGLRP